MTIKQRIVDKNAPVAGDAAGFGSLGDVTSKLSGIVNQISALANGGVGLPALNALGSQVSSLASSVGGTIAQNANLSSLTTLGAQMATAGQAAMPAIASQMQTQITSLASSMDPSGQLAKVLHEHSLDKMVGIAAKAFTGQHTTTWDSGGVSHTSPSKVSSTAPILPHFGNIQGSDSLTITKSIVGATVGTTSDARLKTNIRPYAVSIDTFMKMEVCSFDKHFVAYGEAAAVKHDEFISTFGMIAQHCRELVPDLVSGDEKTGFLSLDEGKVGFVTVSVLQQFIVEMRAEIADLKRQLSEK